MSDSEAHTDFKKCLWCEMSLDDDDDVGECYICSSNGELFCDYHLTSCEGCGNQGCPGCGSVNTCDICSTTYCRECMSRNGEDGGGCRKCNNLYYCDKCLEKNDGMCDVCYTYYTLDDDTNNHFAIDKEGYVIVHIKKL